MRGWLGRTCFFHREEHGKEGAINEGCNCVYDQTLRRHSNNNHMHNCQGTKSSRTDISIMKLVLQCPGQTMLLIHGNVTKHEHGKEAMNWNHLQIPGSAACPHLTKHVFSSSLFSRMSSAKILSSRSSCALDAR